MGVKVTVSGLTDLQNKIKRFTGSELTPLKNAVRQAAEVTRTRVVSYLSERRRTGAMQKGVTVSVFTRDGKVFGRVKSPTRSVLAKNNPGYDPKAKWYYPAHQEFGTGKMAPLDAYGRAARETAKPAVDIIRKGLKATLTANF